MINVYVLISICLFSSVYEVSPVLTKLEELEVPSDVVSVSKFIEQFHVSIFIILNLIILNLIYIYT